MYKIYDFIKVILHDFDNIYIRIFCKNYTHKKC